LLVKKRSPTELVASTQRNIAIVVEDKDPKSVKKSSEKIAANLYNMKKMLYGDGDNDAKPDDIRKLCDELIRSDVLLPMINHIKRFEFEARKDVAQIYSFILRQRKEDGVAYIRQRPEILRTLVQGYAEPEIALNCGIIIREVIRHEELTPLVLEDRELFGAFFKYVQLSTFDVASDAFATFKALLTKHKVLCAKFLEAHFDEVFNEYNQLLQSDNYVTKRQSLKLLGELLQNRQNFRVMMKYINSSDNLKIMMNLLRGTTRAIQFEAFHVFKIFVANPKKSDPVIRILLQNKEKLIEFLQKFTKDPDDATFNEEKGLLLATLAKLNDSMMVDQASS
jgi:calcium binding protein 39